MKPQSLPSAAYASGDSYLHHATERALEYHIRPRLPPTRTRHTKGFNLTELVAVLAIVTLVVALLLPGLRAARERARTIQCLSNLRSIGGGLRLFADEQEGSFPRVVDIEQTPLQVRIALEPYLGVKRVFICPRDPLVPIPPGGSYDWRLTDNPKCSLAKGKIDQIRRPSLVALGGDRNPSWHRLNFITVLFADLHVNQMEKDDWFQNIKSPLW